MVYLPVPVPVPVPVSVPVPAFVCACSCACAVSVSVSVAVIMYVRVSVWLCMYLRTWACTRVCMCMYICVCVSACLHVRVVAYRFVWHDIITCVIWSIHMYDVELVFQIRIPMPFRISTYEIYLHSHIWNDFMGGTWSIHEYNMVYSYMKHDSVSLFMWIMPT